MATPNRGGVKKGKITRDSSIAKGWPDVWMRLIDALYDLASSGNFIGMALFIFGACLFIIVWRMPPNDFGAVGNFLASESFYLFPLLAALAVSVITNIIQARFYKAHIVDLAESRNFIVHGLKSEKLTQLENHHTSGFDLNSGNTCNSREEHKNADL